MVNGSMRTSEIFESIRGLFSSVGQERQLIDVNQLAAEALDLLGEELNPFGIQISMQQAPQLPLIMAHKGQLREVILNLIQNAIDAMKTVSGRRRILRIKTGRHGNGAIVISVEDTGPGIDPEKMKSHIRSLLLHESERNGIGSGDMQINRRASSR